MRVSRLFRTNGFTLVEMMIVLAIVAILVGIGLPPFNDSVRDKRLSALTSEFISAVYVARNESLTRRKEISLKPKISGRWQSGWTISDDIDAKILHEYTNPNAETMQVLDKTSHAPLAVTAFKFKPNGQVTNAANVSLGEVEFYICDDRSREIGRTLKLSPFGTLQNELNKSAADCNP